MSTEISAFGFYGIYLEAELLDNVMDKVSNETLEDSALSWMSWSNHSPQDSRAYEEEEAQRL